MEREGRFGEKDQVLVNLMGLELEESIRMGKGVTFGTRNLEAM